jgi:hypothetical protein
MECILLNTMATAIISMAVEMVPAKSVRLHALEPPKVLAMQKPVAAGVHQVTANHAE